MDNSSLFLACFPCFSPLTTEERILKLLAVNFYQWLLLLNCNLLHIHEELELSISDCITVNQYLTYSDQPKKVDMNPEKRMKAAYTDFEATRLPQLKAENQNLRLSQLKQMLKKEWQKSPDNPLNARLLKWWRGSAWWRMSKICDSFACISPALKFIVTKQLSFELIPIIKWTTHWILDNCVYPSSLFILVSEWVLLKSSQHTTVTDYIF